MICLRSKAHLDLLNALALSQSVGHCHKWNDLLKTGKNQAFDPFLAIFDFGFDNSPFRELPDFRGFDSWFLHVERWRQRRLDARIRSDVGSDALFNLWEYFSNNLTELLRRARMDAGIPRSGGVLAFVGGLTKCLVINYEIVGETPRLHPVAIIPDPKSAFDILGAIDQADATARNALKSILETGHKIVAHRGVLIHVDRRNDSNVFGPSIDTLVLSEILAQQLIEAEQTKVETAMEIGCGNGMLTSMLCKYLDFEELYSMDVSFNAVSCTSRNLSIINRGYRRDSSKSMFLIAGEFRPDLINRQFDLIVCNPPYIPLDPHFGMSPQTVADFFQAVAGTTLIKDLLQSAPTLLKPGGRLLMMTSSLSIDEALSWVPHNLKVSRPLGDQGIEVFFDVEAVLNHQDWLSYLIDSCGLIKRDDLFYHSLHPIWLERTGMTGTNGG